MAGDRVWPMAPRSGAAAVTVRTAPERPAVRTQSAIVAFCVVRRPLRISRNHARAQNLRSGQHARRLALPAGPPGDPRSHSLCRLRARHLAAQEERIWRPPFGSGIRCHRMQPTERDLRRLACRDGSAAGCSYGGTAIGIMLATILYRIATVVIPCAMAVEPPRAAAARWQESAKQGLQIGGWIGHESGVGVPSTFQKPFGDHVRPRVVDCVHREERGAGEIPD